MSDIYEHLIDDDATRCRIYISPSIYVGRVMVGDDGGFKIYLQDDYRDRIPRSVVEDAFMYLERRSVELTKRL